MPYRQMNVHQKHNRMPSKQALLKLFSQLEQHISDADTKSAESCLKSINSDIVNWCESNSPPNEEELRAVHKQLDLLTAQATRVKTQTQQELLKHKQSHHAIAKYKSSP